MICGYGTALRLQLATALPRHDGAGGYCYLSMWAVMDDGSGKAGMDERVEMDGCVGGQVHMGGGQLQVERAWCIGYGMGPQQGRMVLGRRAAIAGDELSV